MTFMLGQPGLNIFESVDTDPRYIGESGAKNLRHSTS